MRQMQMFEHPETFMYRLRTMIDNSFLWCQWYSYLPGSLSIKSCFQKRWSEQKIRIWFATASILLTWSTTIKLACPKMKELILKGDSFRSCPAFFYLFTSTFPILTCKVLKNKWIKNSTIYILRDKLATYQYFL